MNSMNINEVKEYKGNEMVYYRNIIFKWNLDNYLFYRYMCWVILIINCIVWIIKQILLKQIWLSQVREESSKCKWINWSKKVKSWNMQPLLELEDSERTSICKVIK